MARDGPSNGTPAAPAAESPVRCGVVGVGRMGRNHARKYAEMKGAVLVGVVDQDKERRESVAEKHGCAGLSRAEDLIRAGVQAVSIAVPTVDHLRCAAPLLEAGVACLIEKPLASDIAEARRLKEIAERTGAVLMVGHIERFNPAVRALQKAQREMEAAGQPGIVPRFIEVIRVSPMTFRSVDVSVVMDMMIHDLDVVLMLMGGREPTRIDASGVSVLTEHEDVCNARLTFHLPGVGRCVANVTASRLATKTERRIRIIGENAYVSIDYAAKKGVLIRRTANALPIEEIREALRRGADLSDLDYKNLVAIEPLDPPESEGADQLEMELSEFLDAVRTGGKPPVDAEAGFINVRTAHRIMEECRKDWPA